MLPFKGKRTKYKPDLEKYWKRVHNEYDPDVVHIHGTEYPYGLAYVNVCGNNNVCVSIQGMTSVCAKHYYADISKVEVLKNITLSDLLIGHAIIGGHREFVRRGCIEIELLRKVRHVIGRTTWDRMHTESINEDVKYHFCNETLRQVFYTNKWTYNKCDKHTIFIPQASYPIKGLHKMLDALYIVKCRYPDVKLHVAGANIIKHRTVKEKLALSGYGKLILKKIKKCIWKKK